MEGDPFALLESMVIAGLAMGAEHGWIYLRAEYPLAHARLRNAIAACRARGLLGNDIMQRGVRFDIELRRGAGAYICGEESALLNSLEGFRGEPRTRPPFPVESGLFGQPTAINNVETLMNVPWIVREGAAAFRSVGTRDSPGTRLFSVSGAVERPGVYEVAHGTTLQSLLGLAGARPLRAVLLGGAAGSFVAPDDFALPLTLEDTRKVGATLGSGVVLALDASVDLEAMLVRMAKFFRDESCGQCVPCRVGTVRQHELVTRLARHTPHASIEAELETFRDLARCMRDASICGLGHTAANAIESAMTRLDVWKEPLAHETPPGLVTAASRRG
jgi:NADH-quinone oxidoreductase subunit F